MKETAITNSELGTYAYNSTYDTMEYTWTETCHNDNHGYSTHVWSNCDNTNIYANSKVKEFLEGTYINTLGENNLKEVDDYKIRLISWDELLGQLGYSMDITSRNNGIEPVANENVPSWVYQDFGENENTNLYGYWTMTPNANESQNVWYVSSDGTIYNKNTTEYPYYVGVRPVINLLKTSIE